MFLRVAYCGLIKCCSVSPYIFLHPFHLASTNHKADRQLLFLLIILLRVSAVYVFVCVCVCVCVCVFVCE